ncbi:hypothetical protein [Leeia oryzae]|uniref:hypothetical protein n=1 Tax=Leeia oryzae TaxID=356662 RepID=UPI00038230F4|nr:hypothetical protein [Leeia oryzae]
MQIQRQYLKEASDKGIISESQASVLWAFLNEKGAHTPSFRFTHILYYLGGMIAIGAMSLFMTLAWESFGGWGIFFIALLYAGLGLRLTEHFLYQLKLQIPTGLTATFVIVLTPLAVYGLQSGLGWWTDPGAYRDYHVYIDWRWIFMEFATLIVAAVMLWRYQLPFQVMPVAVTLWYMSMDFAPFLFGEDADWDIRKLLSVWFGVMMIFIAIWVDIRARKDKDYAFWLYLFGTMAFWGGLSSMNSDSELNKFIYMCINLGMIALSAILSRRVFAVFGAIGVASYLGYLAYHVFQDSLLFPFALTLIGLGVVYMGILWQRHEAAISNWLLDKLPAPLQEFLENRN